MLPIGSSSPVLPYPTAGAARRKVQTERLVTNASSGVFTSPAVASFQINTPSVRLVVFFAVTYQPVASDDTDEFPTSGPAAWTLNAQAWVRGSREQGGSLMRANTIIANTPIPTSLNEPAQGIDQIRGTVSVPGSPGTGIDPGTLWLTVIWEPAPGDNIPDSELQDTFGKCYALTQGTFSSTTGVGGG